MEQAEKRKVLCKGLQHVGIPTNDLQKSLDFYQSLGFETVYRTRNEAAGEDVAFCRLGDLTLELYENGKAAGYPGPSTTWRWTSPTWKGPMPWCSSWGIRW